MPAPAPAIDPETLQHLLDALPAPAEPLDVVMLDGFLCALLLRETPPPTAAWLPWALDIEGRALPAAATAPAQHALEQRLLALREAVTQRQWFDPWVFELDDDAAPAETVLPWAAGFALAAERWPLPLARGGDDGNEALALVYQALDPDDWPVAAALADRIDAMEPPGSLAEAVEDLVRAVLLLSDITGPGPAARRSARTGAAVKRRSIRR